MSSFPKHVRGDRVSEPPSLYYEKATDKNSDPDFLCDDDEDDDTLKKSFNLSFIFDLFRAAMMDGKGDKNGNSSPRLSKGPKDSDYVMLVLDQNHKKDDDIAILIDQLQENGVTCIFFTRNDIRNGTHKASTEIPDINKIKQLSIRSSQASALKQSIIENDPLSPSLVDPVTPPVQNLNGITSNKIHTLSIPTNLKPTGDKRSLLTSNHTTKILNSSLSPLPPLLSPQIELLEYRNTNDNDESVLSSACSQDQESSTMVVATPVKQPRKKRRRKKKYPYYTRKPTKKRNIWKELDDVEVTVPPQTIQLDDNSVRNIVPVITVTTSDPYAFIPDDDDIEAPVIERPYTPKKSRVNGLSNDCVVKVNGEISKPIVVESNLSPNSLETPPLVDPRAFSPDIVTETADSQSRRKTAASKKRKSSKSKVQTKLKKCVQTISKDNGVKVFDDLLTSDLSISERSTLAQNNLKLENPNLTNHTGSEDSSKQAADTSSTLKSQPEDISEEVIVGTRVTGESTNVAQEHLENTEIKKEVNLVVQDRLKVKLKDGEHHLPPPMPEATFMDAMQLRRPSFYSQISGNVRNNMEHFLDGRMTEVKVPKRKKRARNGFLLHHGDNFPEDPEAPYRLHLSTQITLKLNKGSRSKLKTKEDKGKSLLSYLKLVPKRSSRAGKSSANLQPPEEPVNVPEGGPSSVFSGEWTQDRMFVCNICGHVEDYFWNMVTHKGEIHPGIVVTHVELPDQPPVGFRFPPNEPATSTLPPPPPCTKCSTTYSNYPDLHRHIFECAGNASWLEEKKPPRKKPKKKRGFKRRLSNTPKKVKVSSPKKPDRRNSEVFKCEFCTREFKTEGWLKNHLVTHSLPISIPLNKLTLPPRAFNSSRRSCVQNLIAKA